MNPQIRELMNQAMDYYSNGYVDCPELNPEKFARLIVRECIDIAYREGDNVAYLALHFGVES